jgi:hypothetical protein
MASKRAATDRSRLVGMYMSETNLPAAVGSVNRERQNGKFSQRRQRA